MEDSEFNNIKSTMNYPLQNIQSLLNSNSNPNPPTPTPNHDKQKDEPEEKDKIKMPKANNPVSKIQKSLDDFIQGCLNKYKPVENPDPKLYENTTEQEKDLIISKKSTIPDLVIWNKTFNKNECFCDANSEIQSDFPRFRFYLRLGNKDKGGKNKNEKNKKEKKNKKNKKEKNNNLNNEEDIKEGINNLNQDMNSLNLNNPEKNNNEKKKKEKKKKNKPNKENKINENQNKFNLNPNIIQNNKYDNMNNMNNINNMNNNNYYPQKVGLDNQHMNSQMNNYNLLNNKFSMSYNNNNNIGIGNNNYNNNNNNNYNNNNNKIVYQQEYQNKEEINILNRLIIMFMKQKGWVLFSKEPNQNMGMFNSLELFQIFYKFQNNLNNFIVIPHTQNFKITGNTMFLVLSNIIPQILNNSKKDIGMTGENQYNQNTNNNMMYNKNNNNNYINNNSINNNNFVNNMNNNNNMNSNNNMLKYGSVNLNENSKLNINLNNSDSNNSLKMYDKSKSLHIQPYIPTKYMQKFPGANYQFQKMNSNDSLKDTDNNKNEFRGINTNFFPNNENNSENEMDKDKDDYDLYKENNNNNYNNNPGLFMQDNYFNSKLNQGEGKINNNYMNPSLNSNNLQNNKDVINININNYNSVNMNFNNINKENNDIQDINDQMEDNTNALFEQIPNPNDLFVKKNE